MARDNPSADSPRDPHLLAALRHAPDHDVAPPAAVSARVLAQARQALPAAPSTDRESLFERWFGWMSRPMAAGALGSVLIAGVVGMMWREGPPPEAMPGSEPALAPAAAPAPAPAVVAAPPAAERREVPAAAAPAAAPTVAPATPARSPPAPLARQPAREDSARQRNEAAKIPAPAAAPPAAPAAQKSVEPPQPSPPTSAAPPPRAAPAAAEATGTTADRARGSMAPAARLAAAAFDPLAPVLAALISPADQPLRERLAALRLRVQGPWTASEAPPPEAAEAVVDADGRVLGRLWLDGDQLLWQSTDGRSWRARLGAP